MFLGKDLLVYLLIALGGALFAGNLAAVVRPRGHQRDGDLGQAPVGRSLMMAGLGLIVCIWATVSLIRK